MGATLNIHPSFQINTEGNIYQTAFLSLFEKNKIWNQLNEKRLLRQQNKESEKQENIYKTAFLSLFEKNKIWNQLNEERLYRQNNKELNKQRVTNKKIYTIDNKKYYKLIGMRNDYYLQKNSLKDLSASKFNVELYRYTFNGLKAQSGLIKLDKTTNKIFISDDTLRVVHFEPYDLEAIS